MDLRTHPIKYLDVHHTDGYEANTEAVRREHLAKGWGDIGYNSVIEKDGTIGRGRDPKYVGAHDLGTVPGESHNMNEIGYGVSCIGRFDEENMEEIQFNSLLAESVRVCKLYNIPIERVRAHRMQYATDCPGSKFPWNRYLDELKEKLNGGDTVKEVVIYFGAADYSLALAVSNKHGGIGMFCRNSTPEVHPDALKAEIKYNIGGPKLNVPGEVYMSGAGALDTIVAVADGYKAGKV
jgi:hypothetical protein